VVLSDKKIKRLKKKYANAFAEMQHYDETFEKLWGRQRLDITLDAKLIRKLKELSRKRCKPVSRIIEEIIAGKIQKNSRNNR